MKIDLKGFFTQVPTKSLTSNGKPDFETFVYQIYTATAIH